MFLRETHGVYTFGTKKIYISIKNNSIKSKYFIINLTIFSPHFVCLHLWFFVFLVRVGGGFLSIDEFLDQFTPEELAKVERRDPLKRFSEKVSI